MSEVSFTHEQPFSKLCSLNSGREEIRYLQSSGFFLLVFLHYCVKFGEVGRPSVEFPAIHNSVHNSRIFLSCVKFPDNSLQILQFTRLSLIVSLHWAIY